MTLNEVANYYAALKNAANNKKIKLWGNIELFAFSGALPANLSRFKQQIAKISPYVSKVIGYDYASLTNDHYGHIMKSVYHQLVSWQSK